MENIKGSEKKLSYKMTVSKDQKDSFTSIYSFEKHVNTYYVPSTECLEIGQAEGSEVEGMEHSR